MNLHGAIIEMMKEGSAVFVNEHGSISTGTILIFNKSVQKFQHAHVYQYATKKQGHFRDVDINTYRNKCFEVFEEKHMETKEES